MSSTPNESAPRASSGIPGLDDILGSGYPRDRLYLIEGDPGAGKTTLGLQFLIQGVREGESSLYITLSETEEELRSGAASHGMDLSGVQFCEIIPSEEDLAAQEQSTMFHPADVELNETVRKMLVEVERTNATRVVFDSLSELRLLAESNLRYRRQILAFKRYFNGRKCTVLLLDDQTVGAGDAVLQSIVHGVLTLFHLSPEYGAERRRLRVQKLRGSEFRGGYHDYTLRKGGLKVFPRLRAVEHHIPFEPGQAASGIAALDDLLGGGPNRGSSTLLLGPAGVGKSVICTLYAVAGASRGERAAIFTFDESRAIFINRSEGLGIDVQQPIESGLLTVQHIDPAELAPDEFAHAVRDSVEIGGARMVIIDSLNGYLNAMPDERYLIIQLHELLSYLGHQGVVTFLVVGQAGLIGSTMSTPVDASYLADSVILLRFYETDGEIRRALSVVKKRQGLHEQSIRRLIISKDGIQIGEPLKDLEGVLTGMPRQKPRLDRRDFDHE